MKQITFKVPASIRYCINLYCSAVWFGILFVDLGFARLLGYRVPPALWYMIAFVCVAVVLQRIPRCISVLRSMEKQGDPTGLELAKAMFGPVLVGMVIGAVTAFGSVVIMKILVLRA